MGSSERCSTSRSPVTAHLSVGPVFAQTDAVPMRPAGNVHDIEAGPPTIPADPPQDKYMEAFFRDVSDIKVRQSITLKLPHPPPPPEGARWHELQNNMP